MICLEPSSCWLLNSWHCFSFGNCPAMRQESPSSLEEVQSLSFSAHIPAVLLWPHRPTHLRRRSLRPSSVSVTDCLCLAYFGCSQPYCFPREAVGPRLVDSGHRWQSEESCEEGICQGCVSACSLSPHWFTSIACCCSGSVCSNSLPSLEIAHGGGIHKQILSSWVILCKC